MAQACSVTRFVLLAKSRLSWPKHDLSCVAALKEEIKVNLQEILVSFASLTKEKDSTKTYVCPSKA